MSKVKISEGIFLGKTELEKLVNSLDVDGFRKFAIQNTVKYGLINNSISSTFTNGRVSLGTNALTIKHNDLLALDKNGQFIVKTATDNISVPNDGNFYWVKAKYQTSSEEVGTFAIDTAGNLTGTSTKMLEFRGQPNIPTRIRFTNSSLNTLEYDVLEVISDTSAILQGEFTSETNLKVSVVGTFTPGLSPSSGNKDIFQYDSCLLSLVQETVLNTRPSFLQDEEFFLARVTIVSGQVVIQDKRTEIWKTRADYFTNNLSKVNNPLIGVEKIVYDHLFTPRDKNIMYLSWSFRTTNWTTDSSLNKITISAGQGGKYKSTSNFVTGDFDGWRVYTKDGSFARITSSIKSSTQINLTLDVLDPDKYVDSTQELTICPDVEEIEIIATPNPSDNNELPEIRETFFINKGYAKMHLIAYKDPTCLYNIKYRYKNNSEYSQPAQLPNDPIGYFTEASFNTDGSLKPSLDQVLYPFVGDPTVGYIQVTLSLLAYSKFKGKIDSGDIFGVTVRQLDNNNPVINFQVGEITQDQVVNGSITLTTNHYLNLKTISPAKNGNRFTVYFKGLNAILNGNSINIVQDYVNSGNTGTSLLTLSDFDIQQAAQANLFITFEFDGTNWILFKHIAQADLTNLFNAKVDKVISGITDWNNVLTAGFYESLSPVTNSCPGSGFFPRNTIVVAGQAGFVLQFQVAVNISDVYFRQYDGSTTWTSWKRILDIDDYISLDTNKADKAQPGYTPVTLGSGFANFGSGFAPAGYMKDTSGIVTLRGRILSGSGGTIFTLPPGSRPGFIINFYNIAPVSLSDNSIQVQPDGDVVISISGGAGNLYSLDGISFYAEG